nr:IclR family transcriptional regulator C-terminal domain-containing protein [Acetobacter cerevisiae]
MRSIPSREKLEGSAVGLVFLAFVPGLGKRVLTTRANALNSDILAQIETVRIKGFALDLQGYHAGINGVAIPWRDNGEVRASVCLTGPASKLPPHRLSRLAWMMMKHVERTDIQSC